MSNPQQQQELKSDKFVVNISRRLEPQIKAAGLDFCPATIGGLQQCLDNIESMHYYKVINKSEKEILYSRIASKINVHVLTLNQP